jgi:hypothetical protein
MVRNLLGFHKGLDVRSIRAEHASIVTLEYTTELELLHAIECLEESTPEHVP